MRRIAVAALLLVASSAACTTSQTMADPTVVLRQAGRTLAQLRTVSAEVRFGSGIQIEGLTVTSAMTQLQLPDRSDTVFKARQGDFLVDIEVVTISGRTYLRLPFSRFIEASGDLALEIPDLGRLFSSGSGLPALLPEGTGRRYVGIEKVGDVDCDKVAATYTADQVGRLLGSGVQLSGDVQATIWVGQPDRYVRRVLLATTTGSGQKTQVQVDLHDFNGPVTITSPIS